MKVIPAPIDRTPSKASSIRSIDSENLPSIERTDGLSAKSTIINFLKGIIGAGYLSLPMAFKHAGLWTGLFMVFLFGLLNTKSMHTIVHCSQFLSRKKNHIPLSYGDLAYEACESSFTAVQKCKNIARSAVNTAVILLQSGICSVYFVFITLHIKEVVEELTSFRQSVNVYFLLVLGPMLALNMLRNLRAIAVVSAIGNTIVLISLAFVLVYLISHEHYPLSSLPAVTNFDGIITSAGAILYSYESESLVLPLENKLRHPNHMYGVLSVGMAIVACMYATVGFFGYIAYGSAVQGGITLNFPSGIQFTIVKVLLVGGVFFGYVIQKYVIIELIWPWFRDYVIETRYPHFPHAPFEAGVRVLAVLFVLAFAMAVPNLENIIPLVGVTSGTMLAFVFPSLIELVTFLPGMFHKLHRMEKTSDRLWQTAKIAWRITRCAAFVFIGIFGCIAGLRSTFIDLFREQ